MKLTPDRRSDADRRLVAKISDPLERRRARRSEERRDSPRIRTKLWVRVQSVGGSFEEREGNVGLAGAYFQDRHLPRGTVLEVRFFVPPLREELHLTARVLRTTVEDGQTGLHVAFGDMELEQELALARCLDHARLRPVGH